MAASDNREELLKELQRLREENRQLECNTTLQAKNAKIILEGMQQMVLLWDLDGKILTATKTCLKTANISLEELKNKPAWDVGMFDDTERKKVQTYYTNLIQTKKTQLERTAAWDHFFGSKQKIMMEMLFNPVFQDETNEDLEFIIVEAWNITQKHLAETELAKKIEEMQSLTSRVQEIDALRSKFLANISHELKTPLALILAALDKMKSIHEGENDLENSLSTSSEDDAKSLEVIKLNSFTLLKYVNDLLEISKLDTGKIEMIYSQVIFTDFIKRITSHFELLAKENQINYELQLPDAFAAHIDIDKMEKTCFNLISNAFKFTPQNGNIIIRVRSEPPTIEQLQGLVEVSVSDSGPGLIPEVQDRVFERFNQNVPRAAGGTGLGLSIAHEFVQLHGGSVAIATSEFGGAEFLLKFPMFATAGTKIHYNFVNNSTSNTNKTKDIYKKIEDIKKSSPISDVAAQTLADLKLNRTSNNEEYAAAEKRINTISNVTGPFSNQPLPEGAEKPLVLVVEDNIAIGEYIQKILREDYRVVYAYNGEDGLMKARKYQPDCIVTDLMMPLMTGDRMIAEIRNSQNLDIIPIIILTAKEDDKMRIALLQNGAQDIIEKPFNASDLLARVNNLVRTKVMWQQLVTAIQKNNEGIEELMDDLSYLFKNPQLLDEVLTKEQNEENNNNNNTKSNSSSAPSSRRGSQTRNNK
jgi:signal transduction histidine kinase/DNA-binding response OmpR family regulator